MKILSNPATAATLIFALMAYLFFSTFARAAEPTPSLEWVFDAALAADEWTTADIRNHAGIDETNPILGNYPSRGQIAAYGAAAAGLHYLITRELVNEHVPSPVITVWEVISIGVESGYVAHNYSLGLRCRF